ncbi:MAG: HDOD domain-containing protein [Bryobacterales bacterium]|nr:HDOD domain-containing protein [Bryobacterales bacterium]
MLNPEAIAAKCAAIPPFPQVASQVLAALKEPNAPMERVIGLVEKDIALTSEVLKVANSGLYGRSRKIGSVPAAVRLLGVQLFSQIVMRTSVKSYLGAAMPQAQLNRCWAHSMAAAEISKILALRVDVPADTAYSAGLLHDLGRFGLALAMPANMPSSFALKATWTMLTRKYVISALATPSLAGSSPKDSISPTISASSLDATTIVSMPMKAVPSPSSIPLAPWPALSGFRSRFQIRP